MCEIKNKDELCCAHAIVTLREYSKPQAGEQNTFENIKKDRGKNTQQVKEAEKLHVDAGVTEGPSVLDDIAKFQDYLGPQDYRIIVVDACKRGVIFKGDTSLEAGKLIALVKSNYEDENGDLKAYYDGLYSIPGFMNRSYFCHRCCKGYNTEDSAHHNCQAQNCPACKKVNPRMRRDAKILNYGRNQIEVVSCADVNLMAKNALSTTSYNMRQKTQP